MNKRVQLVMQILKTKAKSLGFNAAELKGVAEKIANNLTADDDADEDELKQESEIAVGVALPYLEMAQKNANRIIEENRKKHKSKSESAAEEEDDDTDEKNTPGWAKAIAKKMEAMEMRLNGLAESGRASTRKQQLEAIVKDAGSYGKRILKDFEKRKFESDDEFNDYLEDITNDVDDYKTEMEQAGLKSMVHNSGGRHRESESKELTDSEIDDIAATF